MSSGYAVFRAKLEIQARIPADDDLIFCEADLLAGLSRALDRDEEHLTDSMVHEAQAERACAKMHLTNPGAHPRRVESLIRHASFDP